MKSMLTRKSFIGGMIATGATACTTSASGKKKRWYRGMLHMHSLWSDGNVMPEQAIAAYKDAGYDFISLTDHNRFQDNPDRWFPVGDGTEKGWPPKAIHPERFKAYMKRFGKTAFVREKNGKTEARLLTYTEFKKMFDAPGRFLMLPGTEITTKVPVDGKIHDMHMNVIGVDAVIERAAKAPFVEILNKHTPASAMLETCGMYEKLAAGRGGKKALYILNHPQWRFCDIVADDLIAAPSVTGFEICNNGSTRQAPEGYEYDRFNENLWDVTLVHRITNGQAPLYAFASDDTHSYPGTGLPTTATFGDGYIMVRADELSQDSLFDAISRGDFYASSELDLDDVSFDRKTGTLTVSATPEQSESLKISFITTKKGVPTKPVSYINMPETKKGSNDARKIPIYDKRVGATVKLVEGAKGEALKASYTLKSDDLYVRARVESSLPTKYRKVRSFHVKCHTAWTQPYFTA